MDGLVESLSAHGIGPEAEGDTPEAAATSPNDTSIPVQEPICDVCREVNLRNFLFGEAEPSPLNLGYLLDIVGKRDCQLCCLIVKALSRSWTEMPLQYNRGLYVGYRPTEIYLRGGKATTVEPCRRTIEIDVCHEGRKCEGRCRAHGFRRDGLGEEKYQTELRLMGDDRAGYGRNIATVCDAQLLADWYGRCKDHHERETCGRARIISGAAFSTPHGQVIPEPNLPLATRLIDVEEMRLVSVAETFEFVALSYVWGTLHMEDLRTVTANVERREEPNGLSRVQLPRTIVDAISVTKDLKIKYLWVDSLCIVQDDEYKQYQILNMDRIYGLASLVLVAAAGEDAEAGLVGCSNSPRTEDDQVFGNVQGLQLLVSSPPLGYILGNSKWNTRGWTYQEWHLARRALVFTNQQVYYICSSASYCEDIALEHVQPHSEVSLMLVMDNLSASTMRHFLPSRYTRSTVNSGWIEYVRLVEHYSTRELTYESDTLLAISGLLSNLHRSSRNRFICGLSIGLFHDALFWIPVTTNELRYTEDEAGLAFPTFSWAGWRGAAQYRVFPPSDRCLIEEWQVWADEQVGTLGTPLSELQNDRLLPGMSFFDERPTSADTEAEARRKGTGIMGPNHLHQCLLKFHAEIATLQMAGGVINDFNSKAEALLDQRGAYMGVAIMNKQRTMMERVAGGFRDVRCIAISISDVMLHYMNEPAFTTLPEDTEWVNLLIVAELGDLFAVRIGVGQVSKRAWDDWAHAESKEINLA
ncbi:HET-domain-containing protein [Acephala macrosclerotiorum]|nr:HET-domain-containing protein [Acephala macrosclerotiorum]